MNVGPPRPCPARGVLAVASAEVECYPHPEVGGQVWGWRAVVVPRVAAAAAMRHFPSCRVRHWGESWQRGVRPPTAESTHISLTEGPSPLPRLRRDTRRGERCS